MRRQRRCACQPAGARSFGDAECTADGRGSGGVARARISNHRSTRRGGRGVGAHLFHELGAGGGVKQVGLLLVRMDTQELRVAELVAGRSDTEG